MNRCLGFLFLVSLTLRAMDYNHTGVEVARGTLILVPQSEELTFTPEEMRYSGLMSRMTCDISQSIFASHELKALKAMLSICASQTSYAIKKTQLIAYIKDNFYLAPFPLQTKHMPLLKLISFFDLHALVWDALANCYLELLPRGIVNVDQQNPQFSPRVAALLHTMHSNYYQNHPKYAQVNFESLVDCKTLTPTPDVYQLLQHVAREIFRRWNIIVDIPDVTYGLSIQDLIDSGHIDKYITNHSNQKTLELRGLNIVSLEGLQNIANKHEFKQVSLQYNNIEQVPAHIFDGWDQLWLLNLSYNSISAFPQQLNLPGLKRLHLSHNNIRNLSAEDVVGLPGLITLEVAHNQIGSIHSKLFGALSHLDRFDIAFNNIDITPGTFVPYAGRNLSYVGLNNNQISTITSQQLAGLEGTKILMLNGNPIVSIEDRVFSRFPRIFELYVDGATHRSLNIPTNVYLNRHWVPQGM